MTLAQSFSQTLMHIKKAWNSTQKFQWMHEHWHPSNHPFENIKSTSIPAARSIWMPSSSRRRNRVSVEVLSKHTALFACCFVLSNWTSNSGAKQLLPSSDLVIPENTKKQFQQYATPREMIIKEIEQLLKQNLLHPDSIKCLCSAINSFDIYKEIY